MWTGAALALATLALALYFAPRGFHAGFVDMGHDGYQLRQVVDLTSGGVIFRDTFDQYGPLNGYLNAVGFLALGRRLLAIKYFICGWYAASAVLLFAIARQWLDTPLSAFSVLVWLGLAPFANHGIMISPHAYALLFQAAATLVALRTRDLDPRRFAAVGVLAGLSWAVKQSIGLLYIAAILAWLASVRKSRPRRRVDAAAAAAAGGFAIVVAVALALLAMSGALHDWYLQTIAFPRQFYTAGWSPRGLMDVLDPVLEQFTQPLYWIVIRLVVIAAPLVYAARGAGDSGRRLMAFVTAFLWLATYPSVNFMHQWWTASLAIAPFVACVHDALQRRIALPRLAAAATVGVVLVVTALGFVERLEAATIRRQTLTATLTNPPLFAGIRTDGATKTAFESLFAALTRYRGDHPGVRVVSIETADGWGNGKIESLPLLSFLDGNRHDHPVYWSLAILSTAVYPRYPDALWRGVREQRPLIVDHRWGDLRPLRICGYRALAIVKSDLGHWHVYAPAESGGDAPAADPAGDDAMDYPCAGEGGPTLPRPRPSTVAGAFRGVAAPAADRAASIRVGTLELIDPALQAMNVPVDVYTWPPQISAIRVDRTFELASAETSWRAGRGDILTRLDPGAWTASGSADGPLSYLAQWPERDILPGSTFVARGEVVEGGLQIGFLHHGSWAATVVVNRPGPFEAILTFAGGGEYGLVLANYVTAPWRERAQRHPVRAALGLLGRGFYPNVFHVDQAGWARPAAAASEK